MARIETWFNQDLKKPVKVQYLDGNVFSADNQGNLIGVNIFDNGSPASISGTVSASIVRADGATVFTTGSISGNKASVVLPEQAYYVPGVISIVIKLTTNSVVTTLCAVVSNVYQSETSSIVDPGTIIPSIETLIEAINEAVASIPSDYSVLDNIVKYFNCYRFPYSVASSARGITITDKGSGVFHLQGTADSSGFINVISTGSNGLPAPFTAGQTLYYCFDSTANTSNLNIQAFSCTDKTQENWVNFHNATPSPGIRTFKLPSTSQGLLVRFNVTSGVYYNCDMTLYVASRTPNYLTLESNVVKCFDGELLTLDLNEANEVGWWLLNDSHQYTNIPTGFSLGFLCNIFTGQWRLQLLYQFAGSKIYKRRGNAAGSSWEGWAEISGGGGNTYNITNEYSFPEYSQSVTLNASPTITTDTNNYLPSTGDTTDRTADILAMLTATGICRLGPGTFYVSNLQMPVGSSIIGCGYSTVIRMSGTSDGYAVKINSRCIIQNVQILGADSAPSFSSTPGGRHGILWQGDYTEHSTAPDRAMLDNVWIRNFTGGGITCYDTGYGTTNALEVTNAYIQSCWAGINVSYWSEFHKFTNVRCDSCRVGCVNNGGNNIFVNCDFSSSLEIAMLMDNSQGQSPNNTHGSCIGCVFNHTSHNGTANSGVGIEILNCGSGFVFDGCQIFFSKIQIEDSSGVVVSNCNFGYSNCDISITNGGVVLFIGNIHQDTPVISINNNTNVHFVNCYNRSGGVVSN